MPVAMALAAEQRTKVAHSDSYGFDSMEISEAPAGAEESRGSIFHFLRPIRGLNHFYYRIPTVGTVGYYRALLRSFNFASGYDFEN